MSSSNFKHYVDLDDLNLDSSKEDNVADVDNNFSSENKEYIDENNFKHNGANISNSDVKTNVSDINVNINNSSNVNSTIPSLKPSIKSKYNKTLNYEEIKVSVIIPVFNAERYLANCLESVFGQSLKSLEVIAIDDNSTDNSLAILKDYQRKDGRLRIFKNKENMGPSYNRNLGIEAAKGKYIQFVDADDWLDKNALKTFYGESEFVDLDILIFPYSLYDESKGEFKDTFASSLESIDSSLNNKVFDYLSFDSNTLFNLDYSPVNKMYKTSFLKKFNEPFYEGVDVAGDPLFFYTVLFNAKRLGITRDFLYFYRLHEGSLSTKDDRRSFDSLFIMKDLVKLVKNVGIYESVKSDLIHFITKIYKSNLSRLNAAFKDEFLKSIQEDYKQFGDDLFNPINNSYWTIKDKCFYLAVENASNIEEFNLYSQLFYYKILATKSQEKIESLVAENKMLLSDYNKISDENLNLKIKIDEFENMGSVKLQSVFKRL